MLPKRFEPERTELGVVAWLEILREEFVGISDLRQALAVAAEIQTARSTSLAAEVLLRLDDTLRRMEAGPTPTEQTLRDYLHWVIDQHYYLDPRGTMQTVRQVQVRLQDVYVSLEAEAQAPLSALDRRLFEHELESLVERDDLTPEAKEDLRENLLARYATEEARVDTKPVELAELVRKHARLVILGDPGAGKTTLLRYLALRHAQALRNGEPELPDLGPVRLPLYLRIANYAEQNHGRSLVDYVPACVRGQEDADPTIAALMRERLEQGQCLMLLDGLDEVIEPSQRAEIAAQIDALIRAHEHAGNRFVVTSRVAGYRTAPLAGDMPHYCVRDMNDAQIVRFLQLWCNAVERFQTPELAPEAQALKAQAEVDDVMKAIQDNPGVKRLATNPLLLRVLALIHRIGARLPQRRIELYRLAADTLIRDWELARGIPQAALMREADANRLLAELAAWMHQEKPAGIATEGEVKAQLANVVGQLQGKEPDHPDVQSAVDDFLVRIRQHTGLFVERAPRRYGFMHLTFEEYFAARWLVARPREAAKRIRNKLHRPRWEEPILLAIGFYGMEFPDDVDALVEEAILGKNLGGPSPYEDILHRDLLFAVRLLGDQDIGPSLCRVIVEKFIDLWLYKLGEYTSLQQHIAQIASTLRGSQAESIMREVLLMALRDERDFSWWSAVAALGCVPLPIESITDLLATLKARDGFTMRARALYWGTARSEGLVPTYSAIVDENGHIIRWRLTFAPINVINQVGDFVVLVPQEGSNDLDAGIGFVFNGTTLQSEIITEQIIKVKSLGKAVYGHTAEIISGAILSAEDIQVLLAELKDESEINRMTATKRLRLATNQPEVVIALLTTLKDESKDTRACVADILHEATTQPDVVAALLAAMTDESEDVRAKTVFALGNAIDQPGIVATVLAALKDESASVRESAASVLGRAFLTAEVAAALVAALQDESKAVCYRAAEALGHAMLSVDCVAILLTALKDNSETVRAGAATALGGSTAQPEVITSLLVALNDESSDVRANSASSLGHATPRSEIISALCAALRGEDIGVRTGAASALMRLASGPAAELPPDFPEQLAASLGLSGIGEDSSQKGYTLQDFIFSALAAVAPKPTVP